MTSISSIKSLTLDLPPSCIEFCPSVPDLFVVGTYFLEKKEETTTTDGDVDGEDETDGGGDGGEKTPQKRSGSLVLFRVEGDEVTPLQTHPTPHAILDLHFSPHDPTLLATATSTGSLVLYRLASDHLAQISTHQLFPPETLVLSLAWHPTQQTSIGVTLSTGEVHLCDPGAAPPHQPPELLLRHDLEAWTLCLSGPGSVYSGGDDATLRHASRPSGSPWSDRRVHAAGVTAILPLRHRQRDVLVTGSYDDCIRVLHAPPVGRRTVLAEENLGGGVWRLKLLHAGPDRYVILASCMHAGARVVAVTPPGETGAGDWAVEVLASFEEHRSMNYGSDVRPGDGDDGGGGGKLIVSTSFYDRLLCLWRWDGSSA